MTNQTLQATPCAEEDSPSRLGGLVGNDIVHETNWRGHDLRQATESQLKRARNDIEIENLHFFSSGRQQQ